MPVPCFPALLRDAGYETAFFGKWHAGERSYPDHGFVDFHPFGGGYHDPKIWKGREWIPQSGFKPDLMAARASEWIGNHAGGDKPFCLVVAHVVPHVEIVVPERYKDLYKDAKPFRPARS